MIKKTLLPVDGSDAGGNKIKYGFSLDHFAKPAVLTIHASYIFRKGRGMQQFPGGTRNAFFPGAALGTFVPRLHSGQHCSLHVKGASGTATEQ